MKKILALLLALLLALSCCSAFAEAIKLNPDETPADESIQLLGAGEVQVTLTESATLDADAIKGLITMTGVLSEEQLPLVDTVLALVNNLSSKATIAEMGGQADLLLKGEPVLSYAVCMADNGVAMLCDLIPSYVVVLDQDAINMVMEQLQQLLSQVGSLGVDPDALMNAILPHMESVVQAVLEKVGDPESGEYTFEGAAFDTKVPVNMTTKELALAVLNAVKGVMNEEAVVSLMNSAASLTGSEMNLDLSGLDDLIAQFEGNTDEELPALEIALYSNTENENKYLVLEMAKDDETVGLKGGMVDNVVYGHVYALDQLTADIKAEIGDAGVNYRMDANFQGLYLGEEVTMAMGEAGMDLVGKLFFLNPEAPVATANASIVPGGEITMPLNIEGKTVVTVSQLLADQEGAILSGLLADLTGNGLGALLSKAATIMPDEVTAIFNLLSGVQQ